MIRRLIILLLIVGCDEVIVPDGTEIPDSDVVCEVEYSDVDGSLLSWANIIPTISNNIISLRIIGG